MRVVEGLGGAERYHNLGSVILAAIEAPINQPLDSLAYPVT